MGPHPLLLDSILKRGHLPSFVYSPAQKILYYTTGEVYGGYDTELGLPKYDIQNHHFDVEDMVEILPDVYIGHELISIADDSSRRERVSEEDKRTGYPWGRPKSNTFADCSPHHEHVSEADKRAGYPWGRPKSGPFANQSLHREHVSEEDKRAGYSWGRPKSQQSTGFAESWKQSDFMRQLRSYGRGGTLSHHFADTPANARPMHERTPSPSVRARSYLADDDDDLLNILSSFEDAYRALMYALHHNYRSQLTTEQGRHFDHADDSIVSACAHAHKFDWCAERLVHLKIGQRESIDNADATSWSVPVPFLGLRESVLEVFFPLDDADVSKLCNDILRVLHVRLASTDRNPAGASDADMVASREVVLEELQRRGFQSRTATFVQGLPHSTSNLPAISHIESERFNLQKSFRRRAAAVKRALRLHGMATFPSFDEDMASEATARYEISLDHTTLVTHYEGPTRFETPKGKAPVREDRVYEVLSSTASVTSFGERLHTPEEEGFEHRRATVADGSSSSEDEGL